MKVKYFALAAVLALVFTGCSANREETSSDPVQPTNSVSADRDGYVSPDIDSNAYNSDGLIGDGPSAGVGGGIDNSPGIDNDAAEGGGAGGVDDSGSGRSRSRAGNVVDDIGDAAGDLTRGAGNVVRDAGNAIGNAANDIGRAMH